MSRTPLLAILGVVAGLAAGCQGSGGKGGSSVKSVVSAGSKNAAVADVLASDAGQTLGSFPRRVGTVHCVMPGGGPAPGLRIKALCAARATARGGYSDQTVVVLTETWPWRSFHYAGSPRRAQHHSWRFLVLPSHRVRERGQSGDFPPQYVK
jgi:hypothetical protein